MARADGWRGWGTDDRRLSWDQAFLSPLIGPRGVLVASLSDAAATGIKRTSLWRSDRLYSWATVTVNYALFDSSGQVFAAGSVQNSPEARKIEGGTVTVVLG